MRITINGKDIEARDDDTILQAAQRNDIYIPTLCQHRDLLPVGICRICMVELKKTGTLVPACASRVTPLLKIETDSPRVLSARRTNLKLVLANHADNCLVCDSANLCELRRISAELGIANSYFTKSRTAREMDHCHPYIQRDLSKCILCRRCVRACRELANKDLWGVAYRGHETRIVLHDDADFDYEYCSECTICADVCPVGALINTSKRRSEKVPCAFERGLL